VALQKQSGFIGPPLYALHEPALVVAGGRD
jgi:hypothetical protein